ncbi:hypothetical protein DY000_02018128 [Brassica cretica]|uniref:Uncharacterized protein n=1 Tax=Brassica cretica TaxID=69181 RepID=A0ABQ7CPY6_BRACR|nr:hypothetical protein DY000_02018128 [Brassica cretica]
MFSEGVVRIRNLDSTETGISKYATLTLFLSSVLSTTISLSSRLILHSASPPVGTFHLTTREWRINLVRIPKLIVLKLESAWSRDGKCGWASCRQRTCVQGRPDQESCVVEKCGWVKCGDRIAGDDFVWVVRQDVVGESTAVSEINTGKTLTGDRVFVEKEEVAAFTIPRTKE